MERTYVPQNESPEHEILPKNSSLFSVFGYIRVDGLPNVMRVKTMNVQKIKILQPSVFLNGFIKNRNTHYSGFIFVL